MRGRVGPPWAPRRGNTLVELLVVIAILGVLATVTGLDFHRTSQSPVVDSTDAKIAEARREAIRTGRSVTVLLRHGGTVMAATAHADGRVVADTVLATDHLSGRRAR